MNWLITQLTAQSASKVHLFLKNLSKKMQTVVQKNWSFQVILRKNKLKHCSFSIYDLLLKNQTWQPNKHVPLFFQGEASNLVSAPLNELLSNLSPAKLFFYLSIFSPGYCWQNYYNNLFYLRSPLLDSPWPSQLLVFNPHSPSSTCFLFNTIISSM